MEHSATTLNLSSIIEHHARLTPDKEAIVLNDVRMTYGQLNSLSNKVANALVEMGIGLGDKIALSCPNLPYFPIVYYGIMKVGAAVVPLNILFKPREIAYHLRDSDAKAVFVFEGTEELPLAQAVKEGFDHVDSCKDLIVMTKNPAGESPFAEHITLAQITSDKLETFESYPTAPSDTCAILYTSGTTGQPKGAELTHLNLMSNVTTTWLTHSPVLDFTGGDQKTVNHAAFISHHRSDCSNEHEFVRRKPRGIASEIRTARHARNDGARKGEFLGWRTDDVLGNSEICRRNRIRYYESDRKHEGMHFRRCSDAGRGNESVRGEV